jgi:hypothetical protein
LSHSTTDETTYEYLPGIGWVPDFCDAWQAKLLDDYLSRSVFEALMTAPRAPYTNEPIRMWRNAFRQITIVGT